MSFGALFVVSTLAECLVLLESRDITVRRIEDALAESRQVRGLGGGSEGHGLGEDGLEFGGLGS